MTKKKLPPPQIYISAQINVEDIIESVQALDHDLMFKFITEVDLAAADYDFTKRLRDHFIAEIEKCDAEERRLEGKQK